MKNYFHLGKKLFPITRSISGNGVRDTLKILKKSIKDLKIIETRSGKKVFDWVIPDEWNIHDAYIQDMHGNTIVDFKRNNLHILNYSIPVNLYLSKKELTKNLYYLKDYPSAIPYITSYYKRRWGFCISYNFYRKFLRRYSNNDKFYVKINTNFNKKGFLTYGETLIKGKSKKEILLSTYVCHPSMANNELSGPLVATALYNYFSKKKNNYSIRIVFIPETIGSITYLQKNLSKLKKKIVAGYNLTCLGDNRSYSFLPSKYDSISNYAALKSFKELNIKFKKYSFLDRGSDERQYNSPGVDLPIASIMRSKYGTYKEYHTSKDNFKLVTINGLKGGYTVLKKAIEIIMNLKLELPPKKKLIKKAPISRFKCEPQMSKRNLYPTLGTQNKNSKVKNLMNFLQYSDGSNSLEKISEQIKLNIKETKIIYSLLKKKKLIYD